MTGREDTLESATRTRSVLEVEGVTVRFAGRTVLDEVSFEIREGEFTGLIGSNGVGKTTLLRVILGLQKVESGRVKALGAPITSGSRALGYVPQKVAADRQLPLSAKDLLKAKARFLKLPPAELQFVSEELGLTEELLSTSMGELSGGQFQKMLIAFALLGRPNVLLFDEPAASLDELTEEHVYELLQSLQKEKGMTVLLVSHDLSVVYRNANMVLCLSSKGKTCMGPPKEVLTPAMLQNLYASPAQYYQHVHEHERDGESRIAHEREKW